MEHPHLRPQGAQVSELQAEFIEWLLDADPNKGSQNEWAKKHNLSPSTLTNWKKRDGIFRTEWERRAAELNINPERIQSLVDVLYNTGMKGDVKAIDLYLRFVEKFTPKIDLGGTTSPTAVEEMSDEELQIALQAEWRKRKGA